MHFPENQSTVLSGFTVSPNPSKRSFVILLTNPCNNCEIRIVNSIGQIVKYIKPSETGLYEIYVEGLKTGHYKVIYIIESKIIDTQTVVVK